MSFWKRLAGERQASRVQILDLYRFGKLKALILCLSPLLNFITKFVLGTLHEHHDCWIKVSRVHTVYPTIQTHGNDLHTSLYVAIHSGDWINDHEEERVKDCKYSSIRSGPVEGLDNI